MNSMWKNYGLWLSLISLFFLLFRDRLGLPEQSEWDSVVNAVLGILVIAGVLSNPKDSSGYINKEAIDINKYTRL